MKNPPYDCRALGDNELIRGDYMDLIGKVARCSRGNLGLITGRDILPWGASWIGIPLNRPGKWSARSPVIIASSLQEYIDSAVPARTYTFRRTQTVVVHMAAEGDDYEGEGIVWDSPNAQRDAALVWCDQAFMDQDQDYCEEFMEAETTRWKLVDSLRRPRVRVRCAKCGKPWIAGHEEGICRG